MLRADEPASKPAQAANEQHFLAMMPHHHEMGFPMLDMCQQKATHQELKAFCERIESSQKQESQQMTAWLQSWYGGKGEMPKAEMDTMMAQSQKDMAKLQSTSGAEFDTAFIRILMEHHRMGTRMSEPMQTRAAHAELKQLAGKMTKDQQEENRQLERWLRDWSHK